jgi:hypothetical protein
MLARNSYSQSYVDACRASMQAQLAAYQKLKLNTAASAFETLFFNTLVVVLDRQFVHRTRSREGKDGNPLNEVRMLCDSILENNGLLAANNTIRCDAVGSVVKLAIGSEIRLSPAKFASLSKAFFAEIQSKFT